MNRKDIADALHRSGVGDHPPERCAPHEVDNAIMLLKRLQAQQTARSLMRNALNVGVDRGQS